MINSSVLHTANELIESKAILKLHPTFPTAAVPKTANFGILGLLKEKFGLGSAGRAAGRERGGSAGTGWPGRAGSEEAAAATSAPEVVRIRCGESPSPLRRPTVIRRKVIKVCYQFCLPARLQRTLLNFFGRFGRQVILKWQQSPEIRVV